MWLYDYQRDFITLNATSSHSTWLYDSQRDIITLNATLLIPTRLHHTQRDFIALNATWLHSTRHHYSQRDFITPNASSLHSTRLHYTNATSLHSTRQHSRVWTRTNTLEQVNCGTPAFIAYRNYQAYPECIQRQGLVTRYSRTPRHIFLKRYNLPYCFRKSLPHTSRTVHDCRPFL